jgi:ATP-dependent Clp protease ATP-binding subunit ClpB
VLVAEPALEDTVAILRGLKPRYEAHHGVRIQDTALITAANLSHRYIADRFLPDKAIDLMDEAASACASRTTPCPPSSMNSAAASCSLKSNAKRSRPKPIPPPQAPRDHRTVNWPPQGVQRRSPRPVGAEKSELDEIKAVKDQIERRHVELEQAQRRGDLETAARIQYGELRELDDRLTRAEQPSPNAAQHGDALVERGSRSRAPSPRSSPLGPASPSRKLVESEQQKLLRMEDAAHKRHRAGRGRRRRVRRRAPQPRRTGRPTRPIGSFLFLGPTGVGKTELCKALARHSSSTPRTPWSAST